MPKKSPYPKFNFGGISCLVKCVDVYDGDTITVETDMRHLIRKYNSINHPDYNDHDTIDKLPYNPVYLHCRMAGYNSAEVSHCTPEEKAIGIKAKLYMTELVLGKKLWVDFLIKGSGELIKLKTEDPYGRPIIDVYLLDEHQQKAMYINKHMIDSGHAAPYDGHGKKNY